MLIFVDEPSEDKITANCREMQMYANKLSQIAFDTNVLIDGLIAERKCAPLNKQTEKREGKQDE